MNTRTIAGGIAALTLAALLTACAGDTDKLGQSDPESNTPTAEAPADTSTPTATATAEADVTDAALEVADVQTWHGDDGYWHYYALIENPSDEALYQYGEFTLELTDPDGVILASETTYRNILPTTEAAVTGTFYDSEGIKPKDVDHVEVRGPVDPTSYVKPDEVGSMTLGKIKAKNDDYSVTVTTTLTSDFVEDQEDVQITIVAFDKKGNAVSESTTYVDRLPAGGTARVEQDMYDLDSTKGLTFKAWASL